MISGIFEKNLSAGSAKPSTSTPTQINDPPRQKACSMCPATFTRKTHLDRHIRSHMNERTYQCETCEFQFTRSDLLTRHKKTCGERRSRRKSCEACAKAKVKCNLQQPCQKCTSRGITCEFTNDPFVMRARARASVRGTRAREGTTPASSHASPSTRATSPESLGSIATPSDSTPLSGEDLISPVNLIRPSSSSSCDAFAAFAQLGVGNSMLSSSDLLASSPSLSFSELTNEFMQMLEPSDMTAASAAFGFETFPDLPTGTAAVDAMQTSDNTFGSPSELLDTPRSNSSSDFSGFSFDFSSTNETSVTPNSTIASDSVSEYAHLSPLFQSTKAFCAEPTLPTEDELRVYMYLFFSAFIPHLPIVHEATWQEDDKPSVLVRVMRACGALFVRTKPATHFVAQVLVTAREEIIREYACKINDPQGQTYLILALALLQTLGLSNQHAQERGVSNVYHGMLKMMIAQSRLKETVEAWTPPEFETPIEEAWRDWAYYEMAKKLCCLERLHDCAQVIFFCMSSSPELLFEGYLPCDDALWNARSAQDWVTCLRTSSHYGSPAERLRGANAQSVLTGLIERSPSTVTPNISTFAHYFLIHVLISCIYSHMHSCTWSPPPTSGPDEVNRTLDENHATQHVQAACILQTALQNWLSDWQDEASKNPYTSASLLPYYRLAQVSLLMLCDSEGGIPWRHGSLSHKDAGTEVRFLVFTEWIKQMRIRFQMVQPDPSPADLREDLMKLCILYARAQVTNGEGMATDPIDSLFLVPGH